MIEVSNETPSTDFLLNELERAITTDPKLEYMITYQTMYKMKYNTTEETNNESKD